ncbi:MAG TPA: hypothetical protein VGO81_11385 [Solirubrobacteraceae bacterium]|nr:hypothetical protein [Solirubrobacteraceae bacterium]
MRWRDGDSGPLGSDFVVALRPFVQRMQGLEPVIFCMPLQRPKIIYDCLEIETSFVRLVSSIEACGEKLLEDRLTQGFPLLLGEWDAP